MTNKECADHLERLKFGIFMMNALIPDSDKGSRDLVDIDALNHAIGVLRSSEDDK